MSALYLDQIHDLSNASLFLEKYWNLSNVPEIVA